MKSSLVQELIETGSHMAQTGRYWGVKIIIELLGFEERDSNFSGKWIGLNYRILYLLLIKHLEF